MNQQRQGKMELFLELACPNADGFSRWVDVNEFCWQIQRVVPWKWI